MTNTIDGIKQQLLQLAALHADGTLPETEYQQGKAELERRLLDLVLAATPPAPAATTVAPAAAPGVKPSVWLVSGLTVGVVVLAAAGYFWKGSVPPSMAGGEAPAAAAMAEGQGGQQVTAEQISGMVDKLAERLKDRPNDTEGWTMLARSYSMLGKHADALKAYEKAVSLRKDDPTLLADYADSMAVNNNDSLEGAPMKLVERALKLDPNNLKALYLAGTYDFNKKDYAGAIKLWEKLAAVGPAGNVFSREVEPAIAEARRLAGMPSPQAAAPMAVGGGVVSGTVTLSAELAKQAQPEDTVFVFARAAEGSRMPLAILRKQVKDLPLRFTLDDSMAMSSATTLSSASKVIVGARISKSGNAMPQPGDLSGQSQPVAVGATGIQVDIHDAVKP